MPTTSLRTATVTDIVKRLTGTPYKSTSEHPTAMGGGMGAAQLGITDAVNAAIEAGVVRVVDVRNTTYGSNLRFIALADGIAYCRTCVEGCDHGGAAGGEPGSCEHLGCWGPDSTNACPGAAYARVADKL